MLNFFFTRHQLPAIQTIDATPFEVLSSQDYVNKVIPFSHIYITSESYLKLIHDSLDEEQKSQLIIVSEQQSTIIKKQESFPLKITNYQIDTLHELLEVLNDSEEINIAVINGIGLGFGDNYIGLAIIQRIAKLLAPRSIHFHLLQTMNKRIAPIYEENMGVENLTVSVHNNCISVEQFMNMNAFIDLTGILNYREFGEMSLSRFYATAFSVENLLPEENLHPKLHISPHIVDQFKSYISPDIDKKKPLVLFHFEASSPLRSCPIKKSQQLIDALIAEGNNVISVRPFKYEVTGFLDCSNFSHSISDLKHIISACDSVVSVGTITYHLAAALGKPTMLLPIVKADIRTAAKSSNILIWLPTESKDLYFNKFKSRDVKDLNIAQQIWKNIDAKKVAYALKEHCKKFVTVKNNTKRINSKPKTSIIISDFGNKNDLTNCIQSLTDVNGFDPLWMQVIDCTQDKLFNSISLNNAMEQAIQNGCEYIWVISSHMQAEQNYLDVILNNMHQEPKTAMVSGIQLDSSQTNKILWAGSITAFPVPKVNQGYREENKFTRPSNEDWVPFDSVIIRTEALLDVGFLDESMQTRFCDTDFCYRIKQNKWNIRYEPYAITFKNEFELENTPQTESDIEQDLTAFINKWGEITQCHDIHKLNDAILKFLKTN